MRPNKAGQSTSEAHPVGRRQHYEIADCQPHRVGRECGKRSPRVVEPAAPGQPLSKLGFSFEWSFPMSSRSDK